ncbi:MAG: 30S ribosomal protein S20 [Patescibacteria group bacterium]
MPNLKASIKDVRRTKRRKAANNLRKDTMKKTIKAFLLAVKTDKTAAAALLPGAFKVLDKNAKNHVIHPNTAARKKSALAKMVSAK